MNFIVKIHIIEKRHSRQAGTNLHNGDFPCKISWVYNFVHETGVEPNSKTSILRHASQELRSAHCINIFCLLMIISWL